MRKHLKLFVAASVAITGAGFAFAEDKVVEKTTERIVQDGKAKVAEQRPLALPAGVAQKDLKEEGDIRNAFEAVTEAVASKDPFDNITNRLVDADRDRVAKFKDSKPDWNILQQRVDNLRAQWKQKYGKDFDLDEKVVFGANGYVAMVQGEIADPAQLVGKWPLSADAGAVMAGSKQPGAAADTAKQANEVNKVGGGDTNLEKGRNVAVARYPAGHGAPMLDLSLIHEAPDVWRFDIPDNVDGKKLFDNLARHLDMLGDPVKWPADQNEAYRAVAHHVLMALYDVNEPAKKAE